MTHAVRETSYEELAKIQAFSNAGALIARSQLASPK